MMAELFGKGLLIALIFGVPAGAIGALTIQRTLERGFWAGLLTGMGSSAADLLYACVGVFGITAISNLLSAHQALIQGLGGGAVLLLGLLIFRRRELSRSAPDNAGSFVWCFLSAFTAALLNPATVVSFLVAFAAFGLNGSFTPWEAAGLLLGIGVGTFCWWTLLSGLTARFRHRVTDGLYRWLSRLLGIFMMLFGAVTLIRSISI